MRRASLLATLLLAACTGRTQPIGTPAGTAGGRADAGVLRVDGGIAVFDGGFALDSGAGGRCEGLARRACNDARCRYDACFGCAGEELFGECHEYGSPQTACPDILCPDCEGLGEEACLASPVCHGVYNGDNTQVCDCNTPGCCVYFERCTWDSAWCVPPEELWCDRVPPVCEGPYVTAYTEGCYEGCARREECAP
jgi:hypothetical protein